MTPRIHQEDLSDDTQDPPHDLRMTSRTLLMTLRMTSRTHQEDP